jgi:transposase InsO family protein
MPSLPRPARQLSDPEHWGRRGRLRGQRPCIRRIPGVLRVVHPLAAPASFDAAISQLSYDVGREYTARSFQAACGRLGICQSMGQPRALDNAVIESWHSTLGFELRSVFATKKAARCQ